MSEDRQVGVGPHPQPWPEDPRLDPGLLAAGDRRNVEDRYRYWRREAIIADIDTHRHDLHIAIENLEHDANIGSIVRTANAFAVGAFHIVGRRRWNRRGAMVTDRYQHEMHHRDVAALADWARSENRPLIAVETGEGAEAIETAELPRRAILLFGQEGPGLSADALASCERTLAITQYGSTRSLNVAAAAAIAMHTWMLRHAGPPGPIPPRA
ncbi:MAG: TrmH family RNA methyltransferase [Brachybacterium sp.]|nr:TrmH family RNA methyltransferase [Brachybacterium sp.]